MRLRTLLLIFGAATALWGCPRPKPGEHGTTPRPRRSFAILGDVRPPHALEVWARPTHRERAVLVRTIAAEDPAFVAIHGDLVWRGSSRRHWARFDREFAPLRWAGIPILPAIGNHELLGSDKDALTHYFARFPSLQGRRWYRRDLGELAILVLDTNSAALGSVRWTRQLRWLQSELAALGADARVKGVVVFGHDPPFTNCTRHEDDAAVKRDVVPLVVASPKTLLYVAGHVHSYERFRRQGKTFLVTGGGGAPLRALRRGRDRRHPDDLYPGGAMRPHHYVSVRITPTGLELTTRGLHRGARQLHDMERFALPFAAALSAAPALR